MIATTLRTDAIARQEMGLPLFDISSLPANSLEFFERGDKKESEEILRDAKFSRGRRGGGSAIFTRFH